MADIQLQSAGVELLGYGLSYLTNPSLLEVSWVVEGMVFLIGDGASDEHLRKVISALAIAPKPYSRFTPSSSTKITGTVYLFEAIRAGWWSKSGCECHLV